MCTNGSAGAVMRRRCAIWAVLLLVGGCAADASSPPPIVQSADVVLLQACEDATAAQNYAAMIARCGEVEQLPGILPERRMRAQILVGEGLYRSRLYVEALARFDYLVQHPLADTESGARRLNARAQNWRIFGLRQVGRWMEIPALADQFAARYAHEADPFFHTLIAEIMVEKGYALARGNRHEQALSAYDSLIERYRNDDAPGLREHLARARSNKANQLLQLKRFDTAITASNECIALYQDDRALAVRELVARSKRVRGRAQEKMGDSAGALASFDQLIGQYRNDRRVNTREQVAWAEVNRAQLLQAQGREREAIPLLTEALRRLEGESDAIFQEVRQELQSRLSGMTKS